MDSPIFLHMFPVLSYHSEHLSPLSQPCHWRVAAISLASGPGARKKSAKDTSAKTKNRWLMKIMDKSWKIMVNHHLHQDEDDEDGSFMLIDHDLPSSMMINHDVHAPEIRKCILELWEYRKTALAKIRVNITGNGFGTCSSCTALRPWIAMPSGSLFNNGNGASGLD